MDQSEYWLMWAAMTQRPSVLEFVLTHIALCSSASSRKTLQRVSHNSNRYAYKRFFILLRLTVLAARFYFQLHVRVIHRCTQARYHRNIYESVFRGFLILVLQQVQKTPSKPLDYPSTSMKIIFDCVTLLSMQVLWRYTEACTYLRACCCDQYQKWREWDLNSC